MDEPVHYYPLPHPITLTDAGDGKLTNTEALRFSVEEWAAVTCAECLKEKP